MLRGMGTPLFLSVLSLNQFKVMGGSDCLAPISRSGYGRLDSKGTSYISPVKPILLVHDYEGLRISRIFGNTPPPYFQIFSSADSLA